MRRRAVDIPKPDSSKKNISVTRYLVITKEFEILYNSWRPVPLVFNIEKLHARFVARGIRVMIYMLK